MCDNGVGKVLGRIAYDASAVQGPTGVDAVKVRIPHQAQGLMVTWISDNNGASSGSAKIYIGEISGYPWGAIGGSLNPQAISCGPISETAEGGSYLTLVFTVGAQGIVIFEFTTEPLKRSSGQ